MNTVTHVKIQDKAFYISDRANTLRKGMNLIIIPQNMVKMYGKLGSL